ncbi:unnamed protein product [Triticum turgidum subsp. durum]|uniref:Ubiquitin-like domain-containing protein n=1 Tax=Triticum turgidum subsp. durum TaxID=4567 RepID=A0A9R0Y5V0_TRITD|nr:unnamed protein product [Triticum turgidum subsp. durum]
MAGGKEPIEVKFRLFDGTDIGPSKYDPATTVSALKDFILARWPQDKEITPKTVNDLKLINGGKILENNRTLAESRVTIGEVPGGVITMHVVVRPPQVDKNRGIADNFTPFLSHCVPGSVMISYILLNSMNENCWIQSTIVLDSMLQKSTRIGMNLYNPNAAACKTNPLISME